jgi:hypothetical protein
MNRQYYVVETSNEHLEHSIHSCIGGAGTQRYSLDGKYILIKTNAALMEQTCCGNVYKDMVLPSGLTTELTYEEALALMRTEAWSIEDPLLISDNI